MLLLETLPPGDPSGGVVYLHNIPIPVKKGVKYLGLHLDEKLKWKTHIKAK